MPPSLRFYEEGDLIILTTALFLEDNDRLGRTHSSGRSTIVLTRDGYALCWTVPTSSSFLVISR